MVKQDAKLTNLGSYYDISIADDGDIETEDSFETSITTILFTDARANVSEVSIPQNQRGWIGDSNFGSKLWIYTQMRARQLAANLIASEAKRALSNFVSEYAKDISVSSFVNGESIEFTASITRHNDIVEHRHYSLWENTGA